MSASNLQPLNPEASILNQSHSLDCNAYFWFTGLIIQDAKLNTAYEPKTLQWTLSPNYQALTTKEPKHSKPLWRRISGSKADEFESGLRDVQVDKNGYPKHRMLNLT